MLLAFVVAALAIATLAACSTPEMNGPATSLSPGASTPRDDSDSIVGTVVRFSTEDAHVDVTITTDGPTSRDFLALLPTTLAIEEFASAEKISYLPRRLVTDGSQGSDPEDGDLIYYAPWGNIGFYYDTSGVGYSDQTINIGRYDATEADLQQLESSQVRVEVVR